ncbi:hypothetical protein TWF679_001975 [Orbilia oligospora]|uniref:NFX1-type zinc finger-containing protein 1 n=2 Tax=Orbilia oligospora TaxID=2813651 RepID=A0A8H8UUK8_ORBOL|nr:hypothetical protein TWF679_001975 [Orbilia oligospora]
MSSAKICFEWRENRCKRGSKCKYSHQENLVEACRAYQRSGNCRLGVKCSRGHFTGGSSNQASQGRPPSDSAVASSRAFVTPNVATAPDSLASRPVNPLESWRKICRIRSPYSSVQMKTFLEGALQIITAKDVGNVQEVIKEFADAKNLEHIRQLLDANLAYDGATGQLNFIAHAIPFLKIITNTEFQNSIVVERYAGTIYNVLYGVSGTRSIKFFPRILSRLKTLMSHDPDEYLKVFTMVASALRHTIHLNQANAILQDGMKAIVREALSQANEQKLLENPEMRALHQHFKILNEQLELGEQIPSLIPTQPASHRLGEGAMHPSQKLHPAIQNTIRLPGDLSDKGPRHDNDHASIANILILPTAEEIRSDVPEYLPQLGGEGLRLDRNKKLLDTQFRLLREDSIGYLRESLRQIIENRANLDVLRGSRRRKLDGVKRFFTAGTAVLIYQNVKVENVFFSANQGLKVGITFDQPIVNSTHRERREWWAHEDVLTFNSLVCILNDANDAVFFTVTDRYVTERDIREQDRETMTQGPDQGLSTLAEHPARAGIILGFANAVREDDIQWLFKLRYFQDSSKVSLIEFPKTLLAAFRPILQGLQNRINNTQAIPFIDWLAPDPSLDFQQSVEDNSQVDVRPPPYASRPDFFFDLQSIFTTPPKDPVHLYPTEHNFDTQKLLENTTLDDGQARSLVKALSREVGLIQGPPGTGKSFVGTKIVKVLLANKEKADLGPVVCVCYTNHALDQFLEHLLTIGINNIVRLGSRSKSEKLDNYLLRKLVMSTDNTRVEGKEMYDLRNATKMKAFEATEYCRTLDSLDSEYTLRSHINENYPVFFEALFTKNQDIDGFEVKRGKRKAFAAWKKKAKSGRINRPVESFINSNVDPWSLSRYEIFAVLKFWKDEILSNAISGLADVTKQHRIKSETLSTLRKERDRRLLQAADIIGVTTSSLAGHADMLERIHAKVLFCEEAGEILEAHTITALIPSIEHMILIGDHEQLRPHVANYDLSVESRKGQAYRLDVSLFERLAQQSYGNLGLKFPIASLNTQRRMHPTIADLIRLKTYPNLLDAVPDYPPIPGMKKRLFWMTHEHPDSKGDAIKATTSYTNDFEQDIVISLVTHLLHQGVFKEHQIAVLTPYLGQMSKLRRSLGNIMNIIVGSRDQEALDEAEEFLDEEEDQKPTDPTLQTVTRKASLATAVRIATIDNFQGEEADVVIISLVRSNNERQCGFLKTSNRINVLLSRAKWGMYIIGDANTAGSVPMWQNVISQMNLNNCLGDAFELECDRHKATPIRAASKEDFITYAPEGGCNLKCESRLECGHACPSKCHSTALHKLAPCSQPCPKQLIGCDHPCISKCSQPCPPCRHPYRDVPLKCGHTVTIMPCFEYQKAAESYYCTAKVQKIVPGCNHTVTVDCGRDVNSPNYRCTAVCKDHLECGHRCQNQCRNCRQPPTKTPGDFTIRHGNCQQVCNRPFNTCSHSCQKTCHDGEACDSCQRECEIRCTHSKCSKKCKEPCRPCAEQCTLGCEHQKCLMPCGVSCNILPCDELCSKLLDCGHQCPSICGEKCPDKKFCRECGSDEVLDFQVDMLMLGTYRESKDEPIIFLPCNHYYTVSTLDGTANMKDFFAFDDTEDWKIVGRYLQEKSAPKLLTCPNCRAPFTTSVRYNEVVKKYQLQNCIRQFTLASHNRLMEIIQQISSFQDNLEKSREAFKPKDMKQIEARYRTCLTLSRVIKRYNSEVLEEEQPYHRVYELTVSACRKYGITADKYNPSVVQYRFGIEGAYQELRVILSEICDMDIIASRTTTPNSMKKALWKRIAANTSSTVLNCNKLVHICKERKQQLIEVQARIALAKFVTLHIKHRDEMEKEEDKISDTEAANIKEDIVKDMEECLEICDTVATCKGLKPEVEETIKSVRGGIFYSTVTNKEMKQIYDAMTREFGGTGHWYICPNGHQFTVGECGQPMRIGTCNECGAGIGGQHHISVEGVTRDADLDARMQNLNF